MSTTIEELRAKIAEALEADDPDVAQIRAWRAELAVLEAQSPQTSEPQPAEVKHKVSSRGQRVGTATGDGEIDAQIAKLASEVRKLGQAVLEFEQRGTWLWLGGHTKRIAEQLRALGFQYSGRHSGDARTLRGDPDYGVWFWSPQPLPGGGKRRRGHTDAGKIRAKYGSRDLRQQD